VYFDPRHAAQPLLLSHGTGRWAVSYVMSMHLQRYEKGMVKGRQKEESVQHNKPEMDLGAKSYFIIINEVNT